MNFHTTASNKIVTTLLSFYALKLSLTSSLRLGGVKHGSSLHSAGYWIFILQNDRESEGISHVFVVSGEFLITSSIDVRDTASYAYISS